MAELLPSSSDPEDTQVVGLDTEAADELMDALSSETARTVLAELQDRRGTPSEVADRVDTSLQNAQYHLGNLEDAGAIEVVDTATSEKGREMDVYAPAGDPVVVFAGNESEAGSIRRALARLLGALGLVGVLSLLVQVLLGGNRTGTDGGGGPGIMDATGSEPAPGVPPGLLFFLGGATVAVAVFALWYLREG